MMKKELNLLSIFQENRKIIFLTTFVSLFLMGLYVTFFAQPVYEAKTQILIYQSRTDQEKVDSQDVQANLNLVSTYSKIIASPRILNQVNENLNSKYSLDELTSMIKVTNDASSQIIELKVNGSNYKEAAKISDETAYVFKAEIPKLMKVDNVNLLSEAENTATPKPVKPRKALMMTFSVIFGCLIGITIILIKVFTDRTIKTSEDVDEVLTINLLGQVNTIDKKDFFN